MRRRHPWALPVLLVLLVAVPIAEVYLLIQVGQAIGVLPTLLILVAEAALGGWLMRREGSKAWRSLSEAFGSGRLPAAELADAALVLVGGVLLMLPGFVTDVIGFFFLLPLTRPLARTVLGAFIARQESRVLRGGVLLGGGSSPYGSGEVIEGETVVNPSDVRPAAGEIDGGADPQKR